MAPKSKKARTTGPTPLGAFLPSAATYQKDESELELEEAVFGRSRAGKGSVWDLEPEDQVVEEYEEEPETGLERLRDENVSGSFRLGAASAGLVRGYRAAWLYLGAGLLGALGREQQGQKGANAESAH